MHLRATVPRKWTASILALALLFTIAAPPFAQASLWQERKLAAAGLPGRAGTVSDWPSFPGLAQDATLQRAFGRIAPAWLKAVPAGSLSVKEIYLPQGWNSRDLIVLHFQDAHGDFAAQEHLAQAIESLSRQEGAGMIVGLEGACGPFDFAPFRNASDPRSAKEIADYFLREALITGPEYAGFTAERPPFFWGVESPELYRTHVRAFKDAVPFQEDAQGEIERLAQAENSLKERIFSRELKEFESQKDRHARGEMKLGAYLKYLARVSPAAPHSEADLFLKALSLEESLDYGRIEKEKAELSRLLASRLSPSGLRSLAAAGLACRAGQISYAALYRHLQDLCGGCGWALSRWPAMERYVRYVALADRIRRDALLEEIAAMEKGALARLAGSPREKALAALCEDTALASKLVRFSLSSREWEIYRSRRTQIHDLPGRIATLSFETAARGRNLSGLLGRFEKFNEAAVARNRVLVENLLDKIQGAAGEGDRLAGLPPLPDVRAAGVAELAETLQSDGKPKNLALRIKLQSGGEEKLIQVLADASNAGPAPGRPAVQAELRGYRISLYPGEATLLDRWTRRSGLRRIPVQEPASLPPSAPAPVRPHIALLVAGGFHTEGMARILKEKKIAYAVLTPALGRAQGNGTDYLDVFRRDRTPLEKLFTEDRIGLGIDLGSSDRPMTPAGLDRRLTLRGLFSTLQQTLRRLERRTEDRASPPFFASWILPALATAALVWIAHGLLPQSGIAAAWAPAFVIVMPWLRSAKSIYWLLRWRVRPFDRILTIKDLDQLPQIWEFLGLPREERSSLAALTATGEQERSEHFIKRHYLLTLKTGRQYRFSVKWDSVHFAKQSAIVGRKAEFYGIGPRTRIVFLGLTPLLFTMEPEGRPADEFLASVKDRPESLESAARALGHSLGILHQARHVHRHLVDERGRFSRENVFFRTANGEAGAPLQCLFAHFSAVPSGVAQPDQEQEQERDAVLAALQKWDGSGPRILEAFREAYQSGREYAVTHPSPSFEDDSDFSPWSEPEILGGMSRYVEAATRGDLPEPSQLQVVEFGKDQNPMEWLEGNEVRLSGTFDGRRVETSYEDAHEFLTTGGRFIWRKVADLGAPGHPMELKTSEPGLGGFVRAYLAMSPEDQRHSLSHHAHPRNPGGEGDILDYVQGVIARANGAKRNNLFFKALIARLSRVDARLNGDEKNEAVFRIVQDLVLQAQRLNPDILNMNLTGVDPRTQPWLTQSQIAQELRTAAARDRYEADRSQGRTVRSDPFRTDVPGAAGAAYVRCARVRWQGQDYYIQRWSVWPRDPDHSDKRLVFRVVIPLKANGEILDEARDNPARLSASGNAKGLILPFWLVVQVINLWRHVVQGRVSGERFGGLESGTAIFRMASRRAAVDIDLFTPDRLTKSKLSMGQLCDNLADILHVLTRHPVIGRMRWQATGHSMAANVWALLFWRMAEVRKTATPGTYRFELYESLRKSLASIFLVEGGLGGFTLLSRTFMKTLGHFRFWETMRSFKGRYLEGEAAELQFLQIAEPAFVKSLQDRVEEAAQNPGMPLLVSIDALPNPEEFSILAESLGAVRMRRPSQTLTDALGAFLHTLSPLRLYEAIILGAGILAGQNGGMFNHAHLNGVVYVKLFGTHESVSPTSPRIQDILSRVEGLLAQAPARGEDPAARVARVQADLEPLSVHPEETPNLQREALEHLIPLAGLAALGAGGRGIWILFRGRKRNEQRATLRVLQNALGKIGIELEVTPKRTKPWKSAGVATAATLGAMGLILIVFETLSRGNRSDSRTGRNLFSALPFLFPISMLGLQGLGWQSPWILLLPLLLAAPYLAWTIWKNAARALDPETIRRFISPEASPDLLPLLPYTLEERLGLPAAQEDSGLRDRGLRLAGLTVLFAERQGAVPALAALERLDEGQRARLAGYLEARELAAAFLNRPATQAQFEEQRRRMLAAGGSLEGLRQRNVPFAWVESYLKDLAASLGIAPAGDSREIWEGGMAAARNAGAPQPWEASVPVLRADFEGDLVTGQVLGRQQ